MIENIQPMLVLINISIQHKTLIQNKIDFWLPRTYNQGINSNKGDKNDGL